MVYNSLNEICYFKLRAVLKGRLFIVLSLFHAVIDRRYAVLVTVRNINVDQSYFNICCSLSIVKSRLDVLNICIVLVKERYKMFSCRCIRVSDSLSIQQAYDLTAVLLHFKSLQKMPVTV